MLLVFFPSDPSFLDASLCGFMYVFLACLGTETKKIFDLLLVFSASHQRKIEKKLFWMDLLLMSRTRFQCLVNEI